jgi:hypothetical protein
MVLFPPTSKSRLFILNSPRNRKPSRNGTAVNGIEISFDVFLMVSMPKTINVPALFDGTIREDTKRILGCFSTAKYSSWRRWLSRVRFSVSTERALTLTSIEAVRSERASKMILPCTPVNFPFTLKPKFFILKVMLEAVSMGTCTWQLPKERCISIRNIMAVRARICRVNLMVNFRTGQRMYTGNGLDLQKL